MAEDELKVIPNIAIEEPTIVHDMAQDITTKVKADMLNLAQTLHCGGCHNTLNFGGEMKAYPIKGRKFPDGEEAYGILCEDCQQFPNKVEEGPLLAIRFEGENETPREYAVNNLPADEEEGELAVTVTGVPVRRGKDGKLTKLTKGETEALGTAAAAAAAAAAVESMPEKEAKHGSRREK